MEISPELRTGLESHKPVRPGQGIWPWPRGGRPTVAPCRGPGQPTATGLLFPRLLAPMQCKEPHLGRGSRVGYTHAEAIGGRPAEPDLVADTRNARSPRDPHGNVHDSPDMLGAVRIAAVFVLPGTPAGHHLDVHFVEAPAGAGLERGDIAFQLAELG